MILDYDLDDFDFLVSFVDSDFELFDDGSFLEVILLNVLLWLLIEI